LSDIVVPPETSAVPTGTKAIRKPRRKIVEDIITNTTGTYQHRYLINESGKAGIGCAVSTIDCFRLMAERERRYNKLTKADRRAHNLRVCQKYKKADPALANPHPVLLLHVLPTAHQGY